MAQGRWAGCRQQVRRQSGAPEGGATPLPRLPCSQSAAPHARPCAHSSVREGRLSGGMLVSALFMKMDLRIGMVRGRWEGGRQQMREGRGKHLPLVCSLPPFPRLPCSRSAAPRARPCAHSSVREGRLSGRISASTPWFG
jgi:hypothetical protein